MLRDSYINTQEGLDRLLQSIEGTKIIAFDTEFIRRTTYYPILSTIQLAVKQQGGGNKSFIIDCFANLDLKPLFSIIANPEITKIFHSSSQDLQIFYYHSQLIPQNIVDTQIMSNLCGIGFDVGYSFLVEKFFDHKINKKQQISDWQKRPLSLGQIKYALQDVIFLEEIYEKLLQDLGSKGRAPWYFEEITKFVKKTITPSEIIARNISLHNKTEQQITQIKNLIALREIWAKKLNVPRRHVLQDETIERIVINRDNIQHVRSLDLELVNDIHKTLEQNISDHEKFIPLTLNNAQKICYEQAKAFIRDLAKKEQLEESFLITSQDLKKAILSKDFFTGKVSGWRHQLFGRELENLIFNL